MFGSTGSNFTLTNLGNFTYSGTNNPSIQSATFDNQGTFTQAAGQLVVDNASFTNDLGATYNLLYAYDAETTYVAGEFYWPVSRGQKTFNRDFAKGGNLLSMEESPKEVTWSSGGKVTEILFGRLCAGTSEAETKPPFPMLLPPKSSESELKISS